MLIAVGLSRGNEAYPVSTLGVNDHYEYTFDHPGREETILSKIPAKILLDKGEVVIEDPLRLPEADLVLPEVGLGLRIISLEFVVVHKYNGSH